jgi:hypothetical protein
MQGIAFIYGYAAAGGQLDVLQWLSMQFVLDFKFGRRVQGIACAQVAVTAQLSHVFRLASHFE